MKYVPLIVLLFSFCCCRQTNEKQVAEKVIPEISRADTGSYDAIKDSITVSKNILSEKYYPVSAGVDEITDVWVSSIGDKLYRQWQYTPQGF